MRLIAAVFESHEKSLPRYPWKEEVRYVTHAYVTATRQFLSDPQTYPMLTNGVVNDLP